MSKAIILNQKEWYFAEDYAKIIDISYDNFRIVDLLNKCTQLIKNQEYNTAINAYQNAYRILKDRHVFNICLKSIEVNFYFFKIYNNQGLCYIKMNDIERAYNNFLYAAIYEILHLRTNGYSYYKILDTDHFEECIYVASVENLCSAHNILYNSHISAFETVRYINCQINDKQILQSKNIEKLVNELRQNMTPIPVSISNIELYGKTYKLDKYKKSCDNLNDELKNITNKANKQENLVKKLKDKLKAGQDRNSEIKNKLTSQINISEHYKKLYEEYFSAVSKANEDIKNFEEVTRKLHDTKKELNQAESKNNWQQEELKRIKAELKTLKARKTTDNNDVKTLAAENESLRQQLDVLRQREKDLFSNPENRAEFWKRKYDELKTETEERSKARIEKERKKSEKRQTELRELQELREKAAAFKDLDEKYRKIYVENQELKERLAITENRDSNKSLLDIDSESELYSGEFKNIILDCIEHELKTSREHSRRYDILTSIIKAYGHSDVDVKADKIKKLLTNYRTLDAKTAQGLAELHIISHNTKKHVKISLADDPRYTCFMPSSGSDSRGGNNIASNIVKLFF